MLKQYSVGGITWIDVLSPTQEELHSLLETCDIPPELLTDLSTPVPRSGTMSRDNAVKMTMDFPVVKRTDVGHGHELKLIVTKTHFVSVRYEDMEAVDRFRKEVEVVAALKTPGRKASPAHLSLMLLDELYRSINAKLDYLESRVEFVEAEIFNHREKEMVEEISQVSRRLINFRQMLNVHEEVHTKAKDRYEELFGKRVRAEFEDIHTTYRYLQDRVATLTYTLNNLRNTNMALLTTKQNEIMKILTIMAFVTFPLSLLTSVFGMNTGYLPIVGHPYDFWIIAGIMAALTMSFFGFFKYKRWM